jgi:chromosome segregation ATPase
VAKLLSIIERAGLNVRPAKMFSSELRTIQENIQSTESEIKTIQSQLLRLRTPRVVPVATSRKSNYPGLPTSQLELLQKLEYNLTLKRQKKSDLEVRITSLKSDVIFQLSDIESTEKQIFDLQSQISDSESHKIELRCTQSSIVRDLSDRKSEVKSIQRLRRDITATLSAVSLRKDIPILDRFDLQPLRTELSRLETDIRNTNLHILELQDLIRLEETELSVPLKNSDSDLEILQSLEDPESESILFDVLTMRQDLKVKRQELLNLQNSVTHSHIRGTIELESTSRTPNPKPKWRNVNCQS